MPLYEYQCRVCSEIHTEFRRVSQCDDPGPDCCGSPSRKIISRARIKPPMEPYQSPIDGRLIRNEAERLDDLRRHDCRPWEGFETERIEADRKKAYSIQDVERRIEEKTFDVYRDLPDRKKAAIGYL